jgi:hypothetical protein
LLPAESQEVSLIDNYPTLLVIFHPTTPVALLGYVSSLFFIASELRPIFHLYFKTPLE